MIGYICKNCGGPAPTGIGYTVYTEDAAEASLEALEAGSCGCGHSVAEAPAVGNSALAGDYIAQARIAEKAAFAAHEEAADELDRAQDAPTAGQSAHAADRARYHARSAAIQFGFVKVYVEAALRLDPRRWAEEGARLVSSADTSAHMADLDASDAEQVVREDRRAARLEGKV